MSTLSLLASLGLNASGFHTEIKKAESAAHHFANDVGGEIKGKLAESFGAVAIEEAFRRTAEYAHRLKDLNLRTGLSTDELQAWDFAAVRAGTDLDTMVRAMERLGIAQAKALGPEGAETFQALQRLGLSPEQIHNLDDLGNNLKTVFETIRSAPAGGQVLKDMREALGRGSMTLLPAIREGLDEAGKRLEEINGRISSENIDRMAESAIHFKEAWFAVRPVVGEVAVSISAVLANSVKGWSSIFAGMTKGNAGRMLIDPVTGGLAALDDMINKAASIDAGDKAREAAKIGFKVGLGPDGLGTEPAGPASAMPAGPAGLDAKEKTHADTVHRELQRESLKLELEQATAVEKQFILKRRIAEQQAIMNSAAAAMRFSLNVDPRDQVRFEEAKLAAMKLQGELARDEKHAAHHQQFDSLARTGGFTQYADAGAAMREPLRQIQHHTQRTADGVHKLTEHMR